MCKWTKKKKKNALYILKCTTRPRDFIVSVSLCIQLTACTHTVSQPAVQRDTKRPPSKPPLPLESHVFTLARSSLHCLPQPPFFPHPFFPPCSALNHMTPLGRSSPSPALKLNKGSLRRHALGQSASCKHSLCVFMHLCTTPCFSTWSCCWCRVGDACCAALLCRAAVLLARGRVLAPELISSMGSRLMRASGVCRASSSSALMRVRSCMLKLRSLSDNTPCPWASQQEQKQAY